MILINGVLSLARPPAVAAPSPSHSQPLLLKPFWCHSTHQVQPRGGIRWRGERGGQWWGRCRGAVTTESNGKGQGHVIKTNGYSGEFWLAGLLQERERVENGRRWHAVNFKTLSNAKKKRKKMCARPAVMTWVPQEGAEGGSGQIVGQINQFVMDDGRYLKGCFIPIFFFFFLISL